MGVIVITGGSRGIGASAAEHAARRGMGVILTYNANPQAAGAVVERIEQAGGKAVALKLDVSDVSSFEAFRASVVTALHETWATTTLNGLVNNAGYGVFNPLATVSEAQFDGLFNVHLKGRFSSLRRYCRYWPKTPASSISPAPRREWPLQALHPTPRSRAGLKC
jgi:NAD(P)-dependent dehydrogenase (short-subunit alcohol dehydrogenase family)